jgi:hypothetical protein
MPADIRRSGVWTTFDTGCDPIESDPAFVLPIIDVVSVACDRCLSGMFAIRHSHPLMLLEPSKMPPIHLHKIPIRFSEFALILLILPSKLVSKPKL